MDGGEGVTVQPQSCVVRAGAYILRLYLMIVLNSPVLDITSLYTSLGVV